MTASKPPKGRVTQSKKQLAETQKAAGTSSSRALAKEGATTAGSDADVVEVLDADGIPTKPRYGAGALILVFLGAQLLSSIAYAIATATTSYDFTVPAGVGAAVGQASAQFSMKQDLVISVPPPLWLTALLQLPLWFGLGALPVWFAVTRGRGVVADLGLRMKAIDIPIGIAIGAASQLLMVPAIYWLLSKAIGGHDVSAAARELTDRASSPISVILLFLIVGIGAPIAEEIYFRGMAQTIFGRRLRPHWAILAAAVFFAATHLQPLQFPALLAFGVVLGVLKWRSGRLGPAIWAHLAFNVIAAAGLVFGLGIS